MNKPTDIIMSGAPHKSGELKNHLGANVFKNRTANPVVLVLLGVNELEEFCALRKCIIFICPALLTVCSLFIYLFWEWAEGSLL